MVREFPTIGRVLMRMRLIIADDHALVMEGLVSLLRSEFEIVATAITGQQAVEKAVELKPDVVLLDFAMPEMTGLDACKRIHDIVPEVKVVFLTMHAQREYVRAAFNAGASGYVLKQGAAAELQAAIQAALSGQRYVSPRLQETSGNGQDPEMKLTPRQLEVLRLVTEAKSAKQIATQLHISRKTVEFHKAAIMDSLGLRTTAELVRYGVQRGLTSPS